MTRTAEILGSVHPSILDSGVRDAPLVAERWLLGVPNNRIELRGIREKLLDFDRECMPAYGEMIFAQAEAFARDGLEEEIDAVMVHEDRTAQKGVSLAFAALRQLQGRSEPYMINFMGFDIPRPFIFYRDLAVVRGFSLVMERFAPQAYGIDIVDRDFNSFEGFMEIDEPLVLMHKRGNPSNRLIFVPSADKYVENARDSVMFVYDPGNLAPEVYEQFTLDSLV